MRFTEGLIKKKHLNNLGLVRNKLRDHTFMIIVESIVFNFFFRKIDLLYSCADVWGW